MGRRIALLLAPLLLVALVSACGEEDASGPGDGATDSASSSEPTETPTSESTGRPTGPITDPGPDTPSPADPVVEVLQATAAGGRASEVFTEVGDAAALDAFLAGLRQDDFIAQIRTAVESSQSTAAHTYVAVASVGCDVPPVEARTTADGGYAVVLGKVADPIPECFAPVTTVAVLGVG